MQTIRKPLFRLFAVLILAICSSGLTGCGRGSSDSNIKGQSNIKEPSDSNILDAVRNFVQEYCAGDQLSPIHNLPAPPQTLGTPADNLIMHGDNKVTISDVHIVKRGKPFNQNQQLPVRVYIKGVEMVGYGHFTGSGGIVPGKTVNYPFEGEVDFEMIFIPPDESKVDPGPGKWIAGRTN